jgi:hypothetical protein
MNGKYLSFPRFRYVTVILRFFNLSSLCVSDNTGSSAAVVSNKTSKEVTQEIQAIIRQITASVTFLPLLNEPCCFDLLVYADKQATVPVTWEDSDPCFIANAEQVKFRSFDTKVWMWHMSVCLFVLMRCYLPFVAKQSQCVLMLVSRFTRWMSWFLTRLTRSKVLGGKVQKGRAKC